MGGPLGAAGVDRSPWRSLFDVSYEFHSNDMTPAPDLTDVEVDDDIAQVAAFLDDDPAWAEIDARAGDMLDALHDDQAPQGGDLGPLGDAGDAGDAVFTQMNDEELLQFTVDGG